MTAKKARQAAREQGAAPRSRRDRYRVIVLILAMTSVSVFAVSLALVLLYNAAFEQQRARLVEAATGQARLMEAVARFDAELGGGSNVVATGGLATLMEKEANVFDVVNPDLTLAGLRIIYEMNL